MAPTHVSKAHGRFGRAAVAAAVAAALVAAPGTSAAHHDHAAADAPVATPPGHAHHGTTASRATHATPAAAPPAVKRLAPAASMWQISSPSNPRVAKGPRGLLWEQYTPLRPGYSPMGGTLAASYVARQLEAAREGDAEAATRHALTTAQATKKLTKKCQKLVKITKSRQIAKLKKADKKARTKCLEQRRKLIADAKNPPQTPAPTPTTPAPGSPTPAPPAPANPTPAPTTPNPTPTTPTTPTNPGECTTPGSGTVVVTAVDEGQRYDVNMCGIKAGTKVPFKLVHADESGEPHDLTVASAFTPGTDKPSGTIAGGTGKTITSGSVDFTADLTPGTWYLICSWPGHGSMRVEFKVFA